MSSLQIGSQDPKS